MVSSRFEFTKTSKISPFHETCIVCDNKKDLPEPNSCVFAQGCPNFHDICVSECCGTCQWCRPSPDSFIFPGEMIEQFETYLSVLEDTDTLLSKASFDIQYELIQFHNNRAVPPTAHTSPVVEAAAEEVEVVEAAAEEVEVVIVPNARPLSEDALGSAAPPPPAKTPPRSDVAVGSEDPDPSDEISDDIEQRQLELKARTDQATLEKVQLENAMKNATILKTLMRDQVESDRIERERAENAVLVLVGDDGGAAAAAAGAAEKALVPIVPMDKLIPHVAQLVQEAADRPPSDLQLRVSDERQKFLDEYFTKLEPALWFDMLAYFSLTGTSSDMTRPTIEDSPHDDVHIGDIIGIVFNPSPKDKEHMVRVVGIDYQRQFLVCNRGSSDANLDCVNQRKPNISVPFKSAFNLVDRELNRTQKAVDYGVPNFSWAKFSFTSIRHVSIEKDGPRDFRMGGKVALTAAFSGKVPLEFSFVFGLAIRSKKSEKAAILVQDPDTFHSTTQNFENLAAVVTVPFNAIDSITQFEGGEYKQVTVNARGMIGISRALILVEQDYEQLQWPVHSKQDLRWLHVPSALEGLYTSLKKSMAKKAGDALEKKIRKEEKGRLAGNVL
jgi:hypothetical protein